MEQMQMEYPEVVLEVATTTGQFLIHLYGHLNWHVGQIDYLRRILSAGGRLTQLLHREASLGCFDDNLS